jgi:hypothetical protein
VAGRDDERTAEPTFGADGTAPPAAPETRTGSAPTAGPRAAGPVSLGETWSSEGVAERPSARDRRRAGAARAPVRARRDPALHGPPPRPRIEDEPSILGLTRHSNSRLGSRLFVLFFVLVYAVIVIELVVALVGG